MNALLSLIFTPNWPFEAVAGLAVGVMVGLLFFGALWLNVGFLLHGDAVKAVALHLARFAALIAILYLAARIGPMALLTTALGFLVGRSIVLRRMRGLP